MTENDLIEKMARDAVEVTACRAAGMKWEHLSEATKDCVRGDIRFALSALPIPLSDLLAVTNGESVIVPVEPTEKHIDAAIEAAKLYGIDFPAMRAGVFSIIRAAMIEARPRHD